MAKPGLKYESPASQTLNVNKRLLLNFLVTIAATALSYSP